MLFSSLFIAAHFVQLETWREVQLVLWLSRTCKEMLPLPHRRAFLCFHVLCVCLWSHQREVCILCRFKKAEATQNFSTFHFSLCTRCSICMAQVKRSTLQLSWKHFLRVDDCNIDNMWKWSPVASTQRIIPLSLLFSLFWPPKYVFCFTLTALIKVSWQGDSTCTHMH